MKVRKRDGVMATVEERVEETKEELRREESGREKVKYWRWDRVGEMESGKEGLRV